MLRWSFPVLLTMNACSSLSRSNLLEIFFDVFGFDSAFSMFTARFNSIFETLFAIFYAEEIQSVGSYRVRFTRPCRLASERWPLLKSMFMINWFRSFEGRSVLQA